MAGTTDLDTLFVYILLTLVVVTAIGFVSFLAGVQAFLRLRARHDWLSRWSELIDQLPSSLKGLRRGDLVCLEGICAKERDGALLVSPIFRASCVAYWMEIRAGLLSLVTHRQSKVLPFRLDLGRGDEVLIDPSGAETREIPGRADQVVAEPAMLDPELSQHLEDAAIRLGSAEPLGITQTRLAPGQPCTIIGRVERLNGLSAPYREPEGAVIGGGTLLIATTDRRHLARQLRWRRWKVGCQLAASLVAIGGSLTIMAIPLMAQPLLVVPLVVFGAPLTSRLMGPRSR